jgi:hypothetical protein
MQHRDRTVEVVLNPGGARSLEVNLAERAAPEVIRVIGLASSRSTEKAEQRTEEQCRRRRMFAPLQSSQHDAAQN